MQRYKECGTTVSLFVPNILEKRANMPFCTFARSFKGLNNVYFTTTFSVRMVPSLICLRTMLIPFWAL